MHQHGKYYIFIVPQLLQFLYPQGMAEVTTTVSETGAQLEEAHLLYFYKYKTQLNLNFVKTILPHLESIQKNLSTLMKANEPFLDFKIHFTELENKLVTIEENIYENRQLLENYTAVYDKTEKEMKIVREFLIETISSQAKLAGRTEL